MTQEENTTLDELTDRHIGEHGTPEREEFEKEAATSFGMDYTGAVIALEEGKSVRRATWNEWGYYLKKVDGHIMLIEGAESSKWAGPLAPERVATDWEIVT